MPFLASTAGAGSTARVIACDRELGSVIFCRSAVLNDLVIGADMFLLYEGRLLMLKVPMRVGFGSYVKHKDSEARKAMEIRSIKSLDCWKKIIRIEIKDGRVVECPTLFLSMERSVAIVMLNGCLLSRLWYYCLSQEPGISG